MYGLRRRAVVEIFSRPGLTTVATRRLLSTSRPSRNETKSPEKGYVDVEELLSKATWSVASLLPTNDQRNAKPDISSKQLHHLLRLSALPPPVTAEEEMKMLSTLSSQLHFVKEIQKVNTTGVEPLRSLRDETKLGEQEAELGVEALKEAFAKEEVRGKYHKRIRRRRDLVETRTEDEWNPLGMTGKKVGRYFVVEGGK